MYTDDVYLIIVCIALRVLSSVRPSTFGPQDPSKRLTAEGMLRHPWTTGEQASGLVMKGVGEKLAAFQEVRVRMCVYVFADSPVKLLCSYKNGQRGVSRRGSFDINNINTIVNVAMLL